MPLRKGKSREDFEYNVKELMSAGHSQKQALAIAYKEQGEDGAPSAKIIDQNGFVTIEANPISRSGIFPYLGRTISPDCMPDKIYSVYRPAEELENPEAIESFKLLPIVDDHEMIGGENTNMTPPEIKGIHGAIGEEVEFKDGVLYAKLKLYSQALQNMIKMGKRALSLGYHCKFVKESGIFNGQTYDYVQKFIRGNHLALVDQARCDVSVLDHKMAFDHFDLALSTEEVSVMADKEKDDTKEKDGDQKKETKDTGEGEGEMTLEAAHKFMSEMMPKIAKINKLLEKHGGGEKEEKEAEKTDPATDDADFKPTTEKDAKTGNGKGVADEDMEKKKGEDGKSCDEDEKEKKAMDSAITNLSKQIESLQKDGFKTMQREVAARDTLANQVSQFVGTFDHAEMSTQEVAKYGVDKLGIKCKEGEEMAALNGYLHGRKPENSLMIGMDSSLIGKQGKYAASKNKKVA